jgi:GH15 family glucan-1,4-alpha-glucosidase
VHAEDAAATASFDLKTGQTAYFILEQAEQGQKLWSSAADFAQKTKEETIAFWRGWIGKSKYHGRWREIVNRSALALKLMTHHPSGSVVAAPTFGLPETIGGSRNWDYRYTWIRDASFTLYALFRLGYTEEAARFMSWIEQRCSELEPGELLSIMYSIDGRRQLVEERLDHLG